MGRSRLKGPWTTSEDALLTSLVRQHGARNWAMLAEGLRHRSGKQCRERWLNHLDPDIRKGDWTSEEDAIVIKLHRIHGNSWARIAKFLPGRTDNATKNRWNSALKKRIGLPIAKKKKQKKDPLLSPSTSDTSSSSDCPKSALSIPVQEEHFDKSTVPSSALLSPTSVTCTFHDAFSLVTPASPANKFAPDNPSPILLTDSITKITRPNKWVSPQLTLVDTECGPHGTGSLGAFRLLGTDQWPQSGEILLGSDELTCAPLEQQDSGGADVKTDFGDSLWDWDASSPMSPLDSFDAEDSLPFPSHRLAAHDHGLSINPAPVSNWWTEASSWDKGGDSFERLPLVLPEASCQNGPDSQLVEHTCMLDQF